MSRGRLCWLGLVALSAAMAGFFLNRAITTQPDGAQVERTSAMGGGLSIGRPRPAFTLTDLDNKPRDVSEWDSRVLVINFWATWCPPCRREIPAFIELQKQYGQQGLQFVGIALDEVQAVREYAASVGINYPLLVGDQDAIDVARAYGNLFGALPYTAIIDRAGRIAFTRQGELSRAEAEKAIRAFL